MNDSVHLNDTKANNTKTTSDDNNLSDNEKKLYQDYVKLVTPTHNIWSQMLRAFICGGLICTLGQWLLNYFKGLGMEATVAGSVCSLILILVGVILTGLGLYYKIVRFGGAGALVPITGFANSVAAPAIEYQAEGQVFGVGCKIFTIAGPVILYGIFTSWLLGVIYYILKFI
jgi:stage V sporulation protein AC